MELNSSTLREDGYRDGFSGVAGKSPTTSLADEYTDGLAEGIADRFRTDELKKSIRDLLDGDSVLQFESFEKFNDWLSIVLAYEEAEEGDDSTLLLPIVFEELRREAE